MVLASDKIFNSRRECPQLATPKPAKVLDSAIFWGGKFWTLSFQQVVSSRPCCFPFWHLGKYCGGKNSGTPCIDLTIGVATSVAFTVQAAKRI
jgi:hypothetical protein